MSCFILCSIRISADHLTCRVFLFIFSLLFSQFALYFSSLLEKRCILLAKLIMTILVNGLPLSLICLFNYYYLSCMLSAKVFNMIIQNNSCNYYLESYQVAKKTKKDSGDVEVKRQILEAVGEKFFSRLLKTSKRIIHDWHCAYISVPN